MLVSKEFYIVTPETTHLLALIAAATFANIYVGGPYIRTSYENIRLVSDNCSINFAFRT